VAVGLLFLVEPTVPCAGGDAATGAAFGVPLPGNRNPVTALACVSGADGLDVLFGQEYQGPIHRWDAVTGEPIGRPLPQGGHGIATGGMAVTPDGRVMLAGRPLGSALAGHPAPVQDIIVVSESPHSQGSAVLVSSGRDGARCWDCPTGGRSSREPARMAASILLMRSLAKRSAGRCRV
jgi:hypothetical protein